MIVPMGKTNNEENKVYRAMNRHDKTVYKQKLNKEIEHDLDEETELILQELGEELSD